MSTAAGDVGLLRLKTASVDGAPHFQIPEISASMHRRPHGCLFAKMA